MPYKWPSLACSRFPVGELRSILKACCRVKSAPVLFREKAVPAPLGPEVRVNPKAPLARGRRWKQEEIFSNIAHSQLKTRFKLKGLSKWEGMDGFMVKKKFRGERVE